MGVGWGKSATATIKPKAKAFTTNQRIPTQQLTTNNQQPKMFSQVYYLIRSKVDGSYLAAHPQPNNPDAPTRAGYLLMFKENFDALSYVNKYAPDVRDRFAVESLTGSQLKSLLDRWGFNGVGIVQDPLLPKIEFSSVV